MLGQMYTTPPFRSMTPIVPPTVLTGAHLRTFEEIFAYPNSHNLTWPDVYAMFSQLGDVSMEANGHLKIIHHGYSMSVPTPVSVEITDFNDLLKLRTFLQKTEAQPSGHEQAALDHDERYLTKAQRDAKSRL